MESLSWGKPKKINIAPYSNGTLGAWVQEFDAVEGSTKLTPTMGKELSAPVEGGDLEGYKVAKNQYQFEYEIRVAKNRTHKIESHDGVVSSEYAVQLIPEDDTVEGFIIDRASVRVEDTYDVENGAKKKYIFKVLKADSGDNVKWGVQTDNTGLTVSPTSLSFTSAADSTGKTITASSTGNITSASVPSEIEWATVTKSAKVATVKVSANANSASRSCVVTIVADGKSVSVLVTQAGV